MGTRRVGLVAAAAATAVALGGCTELPPGFAPKAPGWPVGTFRGAIDPGIYSPGTSASPRASKACRWAILQFASPYPVDTGTIGKGSRETVALSEGDRLVATDCGGWHKVADWKGGKR